MADNALKSLLDKAASEYEEGGGAQVLPFPKQEGPKTDDAALAQQVGQAELGPAGAPGGARAKINLADTFSEKLTALRQEFPEGDLVFVPTDPTGKGEDGEYLFRADPSQPYAKVDPSLKDVEGFKGKAIEVVTDISEFLAANTGSLTGELVALGGKTKGIKILELMARSFLGGAAGELAQEGVEKGMGISDESLGSMGIRATEQGAAGAAGAGAGVVAAPFVRAPVALLRGGGFLQARSGGAEAIQAARRLGLRGLPVSTVANHPLIERIGRQSAATSPTLRNFLDEEEAGLARVLQETSLRLVEESPDIIGAAQVIEREAQRVKNMTLRFASRSKVGLSQASDTLKSEVVDVDHKMRGTTSKAYTAAQKIEEPEFYTVPMISQAQIVEAEARALGKAGRPVLDLVRQIREVAQEGTDPSKVRALQREISELESAVEAGNASPSVQRALAEARDSLSKETAKGPKRVGEVTITLEDGTKHTTDPTTALRALRSQAWSLKTPNPGELRRREHALAAQLFTAVDNTLRTPGNKNKAFVDAWGRANTLARRHFEFREGWLYTETLQRAKGGDAKSMQSLVRDLSDLSNPDNINRWGELVRVMDQKAIDRVREGVITDIASNPYGITKRLKGASEEVISRVLPPKDRAALKSLGDSMDRLAVFGVERLRSQQRSLGQTVSGLAEAGDLRALNDLLKVVRNNGGIDGPLGKSVRAGLFDTIVESAVIFEKGLNRVDFNKLRTALAQNKRATERFLTKGERQILNDALKVQDLLRLSADAGTSIAGAELGQRFRGALISREPLIPVLVLMFEQAGVGRFFTSQLGQRILIGNGKDILGNVRGQLSMAGAMAATLADDGEIYDLSKDIVAAFGGKARERVGLEE